MSCVKPVPINSDGKIHAISSDLASYQTGTFANKANLSVIQPLEVNQSKSELEIVKNLPHQRSFSPIITECEGVADRLNFL